VFLRLNAQLPQGTSRYWVVSSADNTTAGRKPVMSITFTSILPPGDETAPVVSLTAPTANATNAGTSVQFQGVAGTASGDSTGVTIKVYAGGAATGSPVQTLNGSANASTGAFTVNSTGLPQGKYTAVVSQSDSAGNTGSSTAVSYFTYNTLAGDANGDGAVTFEDFVVLSNHFGMGTASGPASGDFNYDAVVDFQDYVMLSNAFGQSFTAAPGAVAVRTTGSASLVVTWADQSTNETGFVVERSSDGVNFAPVTTVGAGVTTYADSTGLSADTEYSYRIKAVNGASGSAYSEAGSNRTLPAFLRTLWVDGSASATGADGSYAKPYNSITTAMGLANAGDGVVVRGGTYKGKVNFGRSGTTGLPITLMAAPGERATISGFDAINGWTQLGSTGIYQAIVTANPVTLYTGMTQLKQARTPTGGWWVWQSVTSDAAAGTTTIKDTAHLTGVGNLAGATIQMHVSTGNLYTSKTILSNDPVAGTITIATTTGLAPTDIYMIKNKTAFITQPGEWASEDMGNGTFKVSYRPRDVSELSKMQTPSSTLTALVTATSGVHDIVLSGFEIAGTKQYGVDIERASRVTVKNNVVHSNASTGIWMRYDTDIVVSNNIVMNNRTGIGISSTTNGLITMNDIGYNTTDGLILSGDVSGKTPTSAGFTPSSNLTASKNYIHHQSYINHSDGIQMYRWVKDVNIIDNVILNNEQGIMTEEVNDTAYSGSATLAGNVIWGSTASLVIFGHNNSNNWNVANNTMGSGGYGLFQMSGVNYNMTENVFNGSLSPPASYTGNRNLIWTTASDGVIFRNPSFTGYTTIPAWNAYSGQDAQSVKADPMFNNVPLQMGVSIVKGSTANTLVMRDGTTGFAVGNKIEIGMDGVVRTITGITGTTITFDVPLGSAPLFSKHVYNWGNRTNFEWDTRLAAGSPGLTMSSGGGPVGSLLSISQYKAGDFNGDGKRDLPKLPVELQSPPDLSWWPT
jgi:parallel beta-helix repeat protein